MLAVLLPGSFPLTARAATGFGWWDLCCSSSLGYGLVTVVPWVPLPRVTLLVAVLPVAPAAGMGRTGRGGMQLLLSTAL